MNDAEYLAMTFHNYYEELAPEFGYRTRVESAKPWAEVPNQNKQLMIAVAEKLLNGHVQIIKKEMEGEISCAECGQVDTGQTGEHPCSSCGLPLIWDDA